MRTRGHVTGRTGIGSHSISRVLNEMSSTYARLSVSSAGYMRSFSRLAVNRLASFSSSSQACAVAGRFRPGALTSGQVGLRGRRGLAVACRRSQHTIVVAQGDEGGAGRETPQTPSSYKERLAAYGLSGVASYGLFNTLYYFFSFLAVITSLPKPAAIDSLSLALRHVFKLLAIVWAGSQITKVPRAACALACAPLMDKLLDRIALAFKLGGGKRQAFLFVLVPFCWGLFFALLAISVIVLRV